MSSDSATTKMVRRRLDCGIEFVAQEMPDRPTVSCLVRFRSGAAYEPEEHLGVARIVEQTLSKGTSKHDGRGLSDALDALGAQRGSGTGRETITFRWTCLPEFMGDVIDLHAEMIRTPTFPEDACQVAVDLALQELSALEDEPMDLARKLLSERAYGRRLGRDPLGTPESLGRIGRAQIQTYWAEALSAGRMQVAAAGAIDAERLADRFEEAFADFGAGATDGGEPIPLEFSSSSSHHHKDQEQDYMIMCWPGVPMDHELEPVERVMVRILAGGMSGRLFTEVREKQGLVYWVAAWRVHPRGAGMIHVGASTTPDRCDKTYATLLREIDRLAEDVTEEELRRAVRGITARKEREADLSQARADELSDDLFHFGRPIPVDEKLARIRSVTVRDIGAYLAAHPRDRLSVLTLGPRQLAG
ncbi:MAG: insulinase family protein [Phycisphaerae bacterium]|nr:insulinase family protein [Phycisphaerae bacterium]